MSKGFEIAENISHAPAASAAARAIDARSRERASIARELEIPYCRRPLGPCVWVRADGGGVRLVYHYDLVKSGG
jgi:hypothetical protein